MNDYLFPENEIARRPPVKRSRKQCRLCREWTHYLHLDEDGLCDYCNDSHAACPRCNKIFSHDELGGNSAFTKENWPACDSCLKLDERKRKEQQE